MHRLQSASEWTKKARGSTRTPCLICNLNCTSVYVRSYQALVRKRMIAWILELEDYISRPDLETKRSRGYYLVSDLSAGLVSDITRGMHKCVIDSQAMPVALQEGYC